MTTDEQANTATRYRCGGLAGVTTGACVAGFEAVNCSCTSAGHGAS